jgi:hypothetical protein
MRALAMVALCAGCGITTNPDEVTFGGQTHLVSYAGEVEIAGRAIGTGTLLVHDFDGDGRDDLALYMDTRDGFRDTFSYLDIYIDDGRQSFEMAEPDHAKWKEGHWAWIDATKYPGLDDRRFRSFIREQDDAHAW